MDKTLRVSRLIEQDYMRIRALDIQPGRKSLVLLKGPNEHGKTSAIRALISALAGKKFDPDKPIREGEDSATVDVTLADDVADRLRVTVNWTPKGRYLTVRQLGENGETKLPAGQSVIDSLVGALAFDPLRFMREQPAQQLAMLMQAIGKAEAFEQLAARRRTFYDQRTVVNRQAKEAHERAKARPDPSPGKVLEERPQSDVQFQLDLAKTQQQEVTDYAAKLTRFADDTNRLIDEREKMQEEIEQLKLRIEELGQAVGDRATQIEERTKKFRAAQARLTAMQQAVPSTDALTTTIQEIQTHNQRVRDQQAARQLTVEAKQLDRQSEELTQALATIDAEVRALLASSDIGQRISGLAVDDEGRITHDAIPISQASGMRQLELSCLICMAANRQLHAMAIDEGDRLDEQSLVRLKQIAQDHNYQVWMTAIYAGADDDLEHVVQIRDGQAADGTPPPPPPPAKPRKKNGQSRVAGPEVEAMYAGTTPIKPTDRMTTVPLEKHGPPVPAVNLDSLEL